jgi:hypothetical protein
VLRLRGSERAVRKPDRFVSRLHQIDSYQNLLEDCAIQFTSKTVAAPWSGRRARGRGAVGRTGRLIGGPHWFHIYPDFSKPVQTCKIEIDAFHCSKNSQILHETGLEYSSQLSQLC